MENNNGMWKVELKIKLEVKIDDNDYDIKILEYTSYLKCKTE